MNNLNDKEYNVELLSDPKFYLENFCRIKTKEGKGLAPFILKEAQKDIFNTLKKYNRIIITKARQIGFCGHPDIKVLTNDLRWLTLREIKEGQKIISVEEFPKSGRGKKRRIIESIVQKKCIIYDIAYKLIMDNGETLIFTGNHKFLSKKWTSSTETIWKKVIDMNIGDEIRYITQPWGEGSFEDGWFGGLIDGEGCLRKKTGVELTISQVDGFVWNKALEYAIKSGYNYRIDIDKRKPGAGSKLGSKGVNKLVFSKIDEIFQILGKTRPARFLPRSWWDNISLPNNGWSKIISIEKLENQEMIDLQTSAKTYIANGFISHNSTAITGYLYHKTITTGGVTSALIGYNNDLTAELLDKIKTFYRTTPDALKPTIHYNTKFEISFPKVDSKILVLPSTENVGRGYSINFALLTELPFWEKAEEKMMTLEASVPVNGKIIIESSPGAVGDLFHRMWVSDNDYVKKEYGWWWNYTLEEIETIKKRMNNPRKFANNYSLEFLTSGRSVFDAETLRKQRKNVLKVGDKVKLHDGTEHIVREEEGFRIYKPPRQGGIYVVGADCSEGVTGGDYSVAVILDRENGEEVGFWRGHIAPDRFAKILNKWGRHYNNALMVVESEAHGNVVINVLKQMIYPSLYFRPAKFESLGNPWSEKLGWKTTKLTRPILLDEMEQSAREGNITIRSKEILDEMTVFIFNEQNHMTAMSGFNDDAVFATAIALQGFKVLSQQPMTQITYQNYLPPVGY